MKIRNDSVVRSPTTNKYKYVLCIPFIMPQKWHSSDSKEPVRIILRNTPSELGLRSSINCNVLNNPKINTT